MVEDFTYGWSKEKIKLYKELKSIYSFILDEVIILSLKYRFKTAYEISLLYEYLLQEIFTQDEKKKDYILDISDIMGVNVITNGGTCRHHSSMLNDIYHRVDISSMILIGYVVNEREMETKQAKINHAIVSAADNNNLFVDSSNFIYFNLPENKKKEYLINKNDYFFYKLPEFIVDNNIWPLNIYDDVSNELFEEMISKPSLSEFDIKLMKLETLKHIIRDKKYIEDFLDKNIEYIDNAQKRSKRLLLIKK